MKTIVNLIVWTIVATVIVYAAVSPENGVIFKSPGAALAVGVIGLGLCLDAKQRQVRRMQPQTES
jgi:hypothetical protein